MIDLFAKGGLNVSRAEVSDWLKKDEDESFLEMIDVQLASYLNGLIVHFRGKKDGPDPIAETRLTNNIVLRKLKIALNLKNEDILELLAEAGMKISKHELSALFRKPIQSQYRLCKDQLLRNFLNGVEAKYKA